MSAWTWTFVKAEHIPHDIVVKICEKSIKDISDFDWMKNTEEKALKRWLNNHKKYYDYYVNECGIPPENMTKEYLTEEFYKYRHRGNLSLSIYEDAIDGKTSFDEALRTLVVEKKGTGYPMCKLIDDKIWVKIPYEIFRYRFYSDMLVDNGLKTIDDLIGYLRAGIQERIYDFAENVESDNGSGLTPQLEARLREFYSQFGDGNFSVHFG